MEGKDGIKLIEKSNAPRSARRYMERDVYIMRLASHRNIVKCFDIFYSRLRTRVIMEMVYVDGSTMSIGLGVITARKVVKKIELPRPTVRLIDMEVISFRRHHAMDVRRRQR